MYTCVCTKGKNNQNFNKNISATAFVNLCQHSTSQSH